MSFKKHNEFELVLPPGKDRSGCKRQLQHTKLSDRARAALLLILDQSASFIITVQFIRRSTGWGEDRWSTVKRELVRGGLLEQRREPLDDGSSRWVLRLDCTPLFSTLLAEKTLVSRGRTRDTRETGGITYARDTREIGGSRDPPPVPWI